MHIESLTRCNLLGRLDLLEGALGFGPGILCALAGLGKFGLLLLKFTLQGLILLDDVVELLLDLANPGLLLLAPDLFLGCFVLGLGQRLLEGLYFGRCP